MGTKISEIKHHEKLKRTAEYADRQGNNNDTLDIKSSEFSIFLEQAHKNACPISDVVSVIEDEAERNALEYELNMKNAKAFGLGVGMLLSWFPAICTTAFVLSKKMQTVKKYPLAIASGAITLVAGCVAGVEIAEKIGKKIFKK